MARAWRDTKPQDIYTDLSKITVKRGAYIDASFRAPRLNVRGYLMSSAASASFELTTRDGNKICKECMLSHGRNLSSLSSSLRTLKGLVNDALSEIVTNEKSANKEGTTKKQESSEDELGEGNQHHFARYTRAQIFFTPRLQMTVMMNTSQMQRKWNNLPRNIYMGIYIFNIRWQKTI